NVKNLSGCGRLIERKVAAGADYFITQPVFNTEIIDGLADLTRDYEAPFFVGIMPITSYNNAIFLHNEVPGIQLSDEFLAKLEAVK
ncbi:methylenetetrahydrofolate reductase, partial [Streptococcus suis]